MTRLDRQNAETRVIGRSINRLDGPQKVTGSATYAYERAKMQQALVGVFATATIGKGEIRALDTSAAEAMPGVRLVITYRNAPQQGELNPQTPGFAVRARPILAGTRVDHYGQPIALVVADTFENARDAAHAVVATYTSMPGSFTYAEGNPVTEPELANAGFPAFTHHGDFDEGYAAAAIKVDQTYETPPHFSQPLEPHATLAFWEGQTLYLTTSHQTLRYIGVSLKAVLNIEPENLVISAPFVGGGFGSKLAVHADIMGAAIASRMVNEPVKVCLTRQQMFSLLGMRPWQRQRVRLGADSEGRLVAIGHEALIYSNDRDPFLEQTGTVTRSLYSSANRMTRHRATHLDLPNGEPVRGPGELPGLLAIESAMDELAEALNMDPVELRVLNDTATDPESGVPLTGRDLTECLRKGAERFGWSQRPARPRSRQEGQWLVGMGMASAIRVHFQGATDVEVAITPERRVAVRSDLTDIGTGSYTILAQFAAEVLGVAMSEIDVSLAHSSLPVGGGSGGSWGASNTTAALHDACLGLIQKAGVSAGGDFVGQTLAKYPDGLSATGKLPASSQIPDWNQKSRHTYGAHFVELAVHRLTGEIKVRRMLGAFSAGRILNPKTARSQLLGGMIWGLSAALREAAEIDPRYGNIVNGDLAEYLLPVHADVPDVDVLLIDKPDLDANPVGVKGVGELGACGASAAFVNALYNACGVRVRHFPVNLASIVSHIPERH
ncbi:xanthine dehydrogenase family protein molybdopterin-binding subunit [Rhizobium leguminosarum]|uniref:xanthine dehydrogenase family protein molybdopterin-binding subunit n=1 Tax=Rhizobium leguminosarum TaxID=384 RepID=UPI001C961B7A|nr:xanthine dehydrogenase family protein molybdopterin-binding subunit [Rhizobium leguminosarum]MBY5377357.1 xanthine dehydrogenase family protein molybdopterin-binding subunit [Rhizobium leguminosarum]